MQKNGDPWLLPKYWEDKGVVGANYDRPENIFNTAVNDIVKYRRVGMRIESFLSTRLFLILRTNLTSNSRFTFL